MPLVAAAIGAGTTVYNTKQTEKRQDNALAGQLRSQSEKQRRADQKTSELIAKEAQSTDADERKSSLANFTDAIQAHKASAAKSTQSQGDVSEAFKAAGSNAALGMTDYAGKIAGLLSSIDAPTQQRQNDAFVRGRYATNIDNIRRFSSGDDFLSQMRLRGIRRNPWLDAAGQVAGAYGANYTGGGNGATTYTDANGMTYNLPGG